MKKVYPINGLEEDCTSEWGRKYLCYVNNISGIRRFVKKCMHKRHRRLLKEELNKELEDE
jgi:hypothetical protein